MMPMNEGKNPQFRKIFSRNDRRTNFRCDLIVRNSSMQRFDSDSANWIFNSLVRSNKF